MFDQNNKFPSWCLKRFAWKTQAGRNSILMTDREFYTKTVLADKVHVNPKQPGDRGFRAAA
jgi:hypothetical protein